MRNESTSYSQRFEDLHLTRAFGEQPHGLYIDIGAGHPVYDNVSFLFYLRGWRGITVEPNPWLAQLGAAVRPRDKMIQSLVGASEGKADFYLIEDFHGMSTTSESNARAVEKEFGKKAALMTCQVTTLAALCERHRAESIDFLKLDVEGGELDVIRGGDWRRFRPKIVVLEAFAPVTLAPSWQDCEDILSHHDYRYAFFDSLNRYYVAAEHEAIAARLSAEPPSFEGVAKFRDYGPAQSDRTHPDHRLAVLLGAADMIRLPLLDTDAMAALLTGDMSAADLNRAATDADLALVQEHLFGRAPMSAAEQLQIPFRDATIRELYRHIVGSEPFRAACGRISASYAW